MIKHTHSWWGIKNTGDDITNEIMRIVGAADQFIIVCGYNFTFKTSAGARPFFDALYVKSLAGVKVLMIFPPRLHGKFNPQPKIIKHCLTNNIPVILNHQNHSKWLLTDKSLYYGSSNFTDASWRDRVEVLSIHDHTNLAQTWAKQTITDFKDFIDTEVKNLNNPARRMKNYRGLLTSTRNAWKHLKTLVFKFNPSIGKVVLTLKNYDLIIATISEQVMFWFDHYNDSAFQYVFNLSSDLVNSVDELCEYAYGNIFNESVEENFADVDQSVIDQYNIRYNNLLAVIDKGIEELADEKEIDWVKSYYSDKNLEGINILYSKIQEYLQ